ncbi:DVU_1551 family NTP transferase [Agathobaculum sp.]|uniref:DVU_1551 family NTP transferase n=1 Tax=Agathobaculum sp. TaxID=2048138 RepID=UPI002A810AFB|nr:nucleotidyltransferase family protein [Agathobaculum sp.]MDY3619515.1 nucleotidyltransferase family protein [Agathobaculum sp.]
MTGAVVLAAGLSSRMGAFKPLLPLGEGTLMESTVRRLIEGGAERVVVVTGSRARDVERALVGLPVRFAHNAAYEQTQMLDSAKIGLRALGDCEATLVLPADIPMFHPETLDALQKAREHTGADAVRPGMGGAHGHPLLLSSKAAAAVLAYDGTGGLKGALRLLRLETCAVDDPGCLLDADTKEDYERLLAFRAGSAPTDGEIEALHRRFGSTDAIRAHCRAVAEKALELARVSACAGVDGRLLAAAALVHDAARTKPQHAARIAQALLGLGYHRMAEITAAHMELPDALWGTVSETTLLYLADKLVIGDRKATLSERFSRAFSKCGPDPAARAAIERRKRAAQSVLDRIGEVK